MATVYFIKQGFSVLYPQANNPHYDLVIEKDGFFKKVQVKYTGKVINGRIRAPLFTSSRKSKGSKIKFHTRKDIDLICIYCAETNMIYNFNRSSIKNKTEFSIKASFT